MKAYILIVKEEKKKDIFLSLNEQILYNFSRPRYPQNKMGSSRVYQVNYGPLWDMLRYSVKTLKPQVLLQASVNLNFYF